MSELITFSEELIPQVVRIMRMGIVVAMKREDKRGNREERALVKRAAVALEEQCVSLMEYWDQMQSED
ncbi:hypothetical protein LCGC14_0164200 [marine sediment metagenome]|uniref:Uncharacterized protein n=1 Tax=marine sediment metagenome TaxID=412755 RepID=A0A0F9XCT7_9ZZZZ